MVTGGAGCIGLAVCAELAARGVTVHLFDLPEQIMRVKEALPKGVKIFYGSILDRSSIREAMDGCDGLIHLAAYLGVRRTENNKLRCIEINVEGTKNILDCAVAQGTRKIVFSSSSEVYGEPDENPITEEMMPQGKTIYAVTKLMGEELCKAYAQRYPQLQYVLLRYFNAYGPYQAAQFVIPRFIQNVMNNRPPQINGDGLQQRSYCYVSDTAQATVEALMRDEANGEIINVGNDSAVINLNNLADTIIHLAGKRETLRPMHLTNFKNADRDVSREIVDRFCDARKARKLLGFKPKVSLQEGIQKVLDSNSLFIQWESTEVPY